MKILYAIQATGNGHISRAMEIMPYLKKYGDVDIFLSGNNSTLQLEYPVKFKSRGLSFKYQHNGTINYLATIKEILQSPILSHARQLPVEKYELILNDYESITALACRLKNVNCTHFGHQASFASALTPRPASVNKLGEFLLKNYSPCNKNIGLHFDAYDHFILPPVIKKAVWEAQPKAKNYVTVYLPSYNDAFLLKTFSLIKDCAFEIFSCKCKKMQKKGNITLLPIDKKMFNDSLIHCMGIITSAGFETPAEALYLKKKIMLIPIKGQYEQLCNAAALQQLSHTILEKIDANFAAKLYDWLQRDIEKSHIKSYNLPTEIIVAKAMEMAIDQSHAQDENLLNTFQLTT